MVEVIATTLSSFGLRPFMAARHVKPAQEWLRRLERELRDSYALAAFLSPDFRNSAWTDQEVGYALAHKKKIIAIQLHSTTAPHGFLERYQALTAITMLPHDIALKILDRLLSFKDAPPELLELVISRLQSERSEASLRFWSERLTMIHTVPPDALSRLQNILHTNAAINTNRRLLDDIRKIVEASRRG